METLGINNLLNLILVKEGVRPAMLLQPADYKEATGDDPKTKKILGAIREMFPELKQSENYQIYQGIIISKNDYDGQEISLERMGEILGYECFRDFAHIKKTDETYRITIVVHLNNGLKEELFTNVCKNKTKENTFQDFAVKAKKAFDKPENLSLLSGTTIENVDVNIEKNIPTQFIINKLIKNQELEKDEKDTILTILYNLNFSFDFRVYFEDEFQYDNLIHIGILLGLLVYSENDTLGLFAPLQFRPENDAINETITNWEKDLIEVLMQTKTSTKSLLTSSNKTKPRTYFKYWFGEKTEGTKKKKKIKYRSKTKKNKSV
jgi:hypothetical protein